MTIQALKALIYSSLEAVAQKGSRSEPLAGELSSSND
jgi:hypothetical protein